MVVEAGGCAVRLMLSDIAPFAALFLTGIATLAVKFPGKYNKVAFGIWLYVTAILVPVLLFAYGMDLAYSETIPFIPDGKAPAAHETAKRLDALFHAVLVGYPTMIATLAAGNILKNAFHSH